MDSRRETRFLLASFSLGHFANDWAACAIWLLAPAIALDAGLSPAEVGLLVTLHSLGASLAYLPAGLLTDHVANRGRLLVGTFWWVGFGYLLASLAPAYWPLALVLAVAGMGDAAWHPIATGVLVQRLPGRRGEALGVHAVGGSLASVLSPLVVGFLLAVVDWRTALQLAALPALAMGVWFVRVVPRVPRSTAGGLTGADFRHFLAVWARPAGAGVLALMIGYHMALTALMAMTPLFLQTVHGYSPAEAGIVFAAGLLAGTLAQPWAGRLSDRVGRKQVFLVGILAGAGAAGGIALAGGGATLVACVIAGLAFPTAIRSGVLALAVDLAGRREGTTLGFVFALMDGVGALGAVLAGLAGETDLRNAFLLAAAIALGAFALATVVSFRAPGPAPAGAAEEPAVSG